MTTKERKVFMTDYMVDMETLERVIESNEDQADLFARKANRNKRDC